MSDKKLIGFIWCRGKKDFSCFETEMISREDQTAIEDILSKYDTLGTHHEANCYGRKFSDVLLEDYEVAAKKRIKDLDAKERAIFEFARAFFDHYAPFTPEDERDYCLKNFKEMKLNDFSVSPCDEELKYWLTEIIAMWPGDLWVDTTEEREDVINGKTA